MASTGPGAAASHSSTTKQLPRDAIVMQSLLKEMGVTHYEPRVINQMLDFVYRKTFHFYGDEWNWMVHSLISGYVTNVVEEARVYSTYAKKKSIDIDDIKLAVKMTTNKSFTTIPPREVCISNPRRRNAKFFLIPILSILDAVRALKEQE